MPLAVGIDLGTTNSLVARLRDGHPELIPNRLGQRLTPSVVGLDARDRILVGSAARAQLVTRPECTVAEVKRLMGSEARIALGERTYSPTEISAFVLRALADDAALATGEPVEEAVVTVPAYFTDAQRQATKDAGELAGLKVERILNEPTAAALAFGLDHLDREELVVVFDLGGGTLDVSVLEMFEGVLEVKASAGNNRLGGSDFDQAIADFLRAEVERTSGVDLASDRVALARLRAAAEEAKIALSAQESTLVSLCDVAPGRGGAPAPLEVELTRARFEALAATLLEATAEPLRRALADAAADPARVTAVVLVGGATRMPAVRRRVAEFFGREPRHDLHPDEAVALGAAIQAGLKTSAISARDGILITDVCPFTLGVEVSTRAGRGLVDGLFSPIIPRNTTVPCTRTDSYSTTADGQRQVRVRVFQGESRFVRHNVFLDEYTIEGVPPGPAGSQSVQIAFAYDINGILRVTTRVASTGKEAMLVVDRSPRRMGDDERRAARERVSAEWRGTAPETSAGEAAAPLPVLDDLLGVARARLAGSAEGSARERLRGLIAAAEAAHGARDRDALLRLDVQLTELLFEMG